MEQAGKGKRKMDRKSRLRSPWVYTFVSGKNEFEVQSITPAFNPELLLPYPLFHVLRGAIERYRRERKRKTIPVKATGSLLISIDRVPFASGGSE